MWLWRKTSALVTPRRSSKDPCLSKLVAAFNAAIAAMKADGSFDKLAAKWFATTPIDSSATGPGAYGTPTPAPK